MSINFFEFLNQINQGKVNIIEDDPSLEKEYNPWMVNRGLSLYVDTVILANEMNKNYHLDNKLQFDYLLHTVRERKRISKWPKKPKAEFVPLIRRHLGCNEQRALEALEFIPEDTLVELRAMYETGRSEDV